MDSSQIATSMMAQLLLPSSSVVLFIRLFQPHPSIHPSIHPLITMVCCARTLQHQKDCLTAPIMFSVTFGGIFAGLDALQGIPLTQAFAARAVGACHDPVHL
jgi:hypothetical protein